MADLARPATSATFSMASRTPPLWEHYGLYLWTTRVKSAV